MAFDKPTRNRLAKFVADARRVIADEFTEQFQSLYGISAKGDIAPINKLGHLDEAGTATAALLRERIEYLEKTHPDDKDGTKAAVARLAREQAFTILNRLAAIRMAEKRGLIVESVGNGYQSKGFKVFETVAGSALGDTYHRYRRYLFCLFDELAIDLGVLFDRRSPQALLFPREPSLLALLDLLHAADLEALWAEDETIGWIYQYYNDPEERKKMRKESAAPRNSRELAVRNQFFTPRYVVEFLTDNTLGRIWYEMTKGETRLAEQCRYLVRRPTEIFLAECENAPETLDQEGLSQEELLRQPVHIPHRPLKDPREIRLLDPACGSMHFGLYAFDLFETIYEESWDKGSCAALLEAYALKEDFIRDVPRLIIEHNIHGIDIDPRATQIAGLSLWLRAQKAWQNQKVPAADRPRVRRSNIVCAEPMPGSPQMLEEFVTTLDPPLLGELVKTVFDKMQLAGEAGSLLKIEEEIRTAIDTARKEWLKQQDDLLTRKAGSQEEFFDTAEQQVIDALRAYAEQADTDSYQRRLFADDAARGFAFIDLCRKRYDAVVMNPPFGEASVGVSDYCSGAYPHWVSNLLCAFLSRTWSLTRPNGNVGSIFDRTAVVKSSYEEFRKDVLLDSRKIQSAADTGWEVLDANVETFCINLSSAQISSQSPFFDLRTVAPDDKGQELLSAVSSNSRGEAHSNTRFADIGAFMKLPNAVVGYDLPEFLLTNLSSHGNLRDNEIKAYQGHALEAPVHYRVWWEVPVWNTDIWVFAFKGGDFSPYYLSNTDVAKYGDSGSLVPKKTSNVLRSTSKHGSPGVAFGKRGEFLDAQPLTKRQIFTHEGHAMPELEPSKRWVVLAILNSRLFSFGINTYCGQHKTSGYVNLFPFCRADGNVFTQLEERAKLIHRHKLEWYRGEETDPYFVSSYLLLNRQETSVPLTRIISDLHKAVGERTSEVLQADVEIDELLQNVYRISSEDRDELKNKCSGRPALIVWYDRGELNRTRFAQELVGDLTAFAVGAVFGRWDIRYATGERQPPELPDPFDPLPVCPPGMLQSAEGLPAEPKDVPAVHPLRISWPGILVDDENHPEDIVARVREAIEVIWPGSAGAGSRAEAIEQEACEILGVKTLRDYFRRPAAFFADHLKRYSKSRRQAPIYWPLSTKSGSYTIWLYYHRLTDQTLHTCLADFLDPKLRKIQSELDALTASGGGGTRAGELREFLDELHDLRDEIERIIKLPWKPKLNDGVLITASPLHKLFRLPKWQKDLKACWDKLAKGEYDWAHLALTIWPQRVEKACEKDRSIAIAHGLEHLCKVEPPKPKKKRGKKAEEDNQEDEPELIEED